MKTTIGLFGFFLIVPIAAGITGCGGSGVNEDNRLKNAERAVPVAVQEIRPRPFAETVHVSGVIKATEDITVSAEEGGVVKEWKYEKGQYVPKGAVIVLLKDDVSRASYEAAAAQYKITALNFEKQQKVFDEQAVSELQFKSSEYLRDAAKAQADLMQARLERTRIASPISGILDDRFVDEGELAAPGAPIARLVDIASVKVLANVPERYAGSIGRGSPVTLTVVALPGETFAGKASYVGSTISPDNRTFPVEAMLRNPHLRLKPEMIVRVRIVQSVQRQTLLLEEEVVQQVDRNKFVVYVEEKGRAQEHVVQLGGREGNLVEITSGLNPGDRVITSGHQDVAPGQAVVVSP